LHYPIKGITIKYSNYSNFIMHSKPIRITVQGQITIPKEFRELLDSDLIMLKDTENKEIKLIPISDAAGRLAKYATNSNMGFASERKIAWEKSVKKV